MWSTTDRMETVVETRTQSWETTDVVDRKAETHPKGGRDRKGTDPLRASIFGSEIFDFF